jgi:hypothetical protein
MKITNTTGNDKFLNAQIGKEIFKVILPNIDKILNTIGCKTEEIIVIDNMLRRDIELQLQFITIKDVEDLFKVKIFINVIFSKVASEDIKSYRNKTLNINSVVVPIFDIATWQTISNSAKAGGKVFGFKTDYTGSSKVPYDEQIQKIVNDFDYHFERDIEVYKKTIESLIAKGDQGVLSGLSSVKELFIF